MFYVYVLQSLKDLRFYTGFTRDVQRRLVAHNNGFNTSTKYRRPLKLVYVEEYNNAKEARRREVFLKSGKGREYLNQYLLKI